MSHPIDWSSVDWTKSNKQITQELSVKYSTVAAARPKEFRRLKRNFDNFDWFSVDWSKPLSVIASELNVSISLVRYHMPLVLQPKHHIKTRIQWNRVKWNGSASVIAKRLGVSRYAVWKNRRRLGIVVQPRSVDWNNVDWNKRDAEISLELGVTRSRVGQKRQQLGMPKRVNLLTTTDKEDLSKFTINELASKFNMHKTSVYQYARSLGIKLKRHIHPAVQESRKKWSSLEWRKLTNADIAFITGKLPTAVAANRRKYAPETIHRNRQRKNDISFWKNLDWSKTDKQLVIETGYSIGWIQQRREKYANKISQQCNG